MTANAPPPLRGMTPEELAELLAAAGYERFRAKQLFHWLHARGARSFEEMANLPAKLRGWLAEHTRLGGVEEAVRSVPSGDGSTKFLFRLADGRKIESVLMPDTKRNYYTLCLSSQVGCAVDCKFCLTGANGFFRHMSADEIVDQVLFARRHLKEREPDAIFRNLVYMGMGEPLLNTEAVVKSIRLLTNHDGVDLSPRRITVSTSGIIPGIRELAAADTSVNLAVSLNAPTQAMREAIMPITRKYPLEELLAALREFPLRPGRRITYEYVLLKGLNDSEAHARQVAELLRGMRAKVNLIPFNTNPALPFERPDTSAVDRFAAVLLDEFFTVSVRWSKAQDISGACGNLATDSRQRGGAKGVDAAPPAAAPTDDDLAFFAVAAAAAGSNEEEEDD
ncbi:MAG: 23S rRNA (adenine(2503)-C(2))-methyltransferase RlmN [Candidatus Sumerlaeia bacterium]|nr:23S rRNA (adenine(2503)-C(2))-methyltransferase RlmN [Candidatus Sumerlaeia bacterium]